MAQEAGAGEKPLETQPDDRAIDACLKLAGVQMNYPVLEMA
jgi:hypothetical protein